MGALESAWFDGFGLVSSRLLWRVCLQLFYSGGCGIRCGLELRLSGLNLLCEQGASVGVAMRSRRHWPKRVWSGDVGNFFCLGEEQSPSVGVCSSAPSCTKKHCSRVSVAVSVPVSDHLQIPRGVHGGCSMHVLAWTRRVTGPAVMGLINKCWLIMIFLLECRSLTKQLSITALA